MKPNNKIQVYIAAPWVDRKKMPSIAQKVKEADCRITHSWWLVEDIKESERSVDMLMGQAFADMNGVKQADVVLLINSKKSEGKAVEQGIAIADGTPIVVVGKRGEFSSNVFHYLPFYHWVDSLEDAIKLVVELGTEAVARRRGGS